ncbi:hypothetical protein AVEN_89283-1, partial [Araneus ventricosus]
FKGHDCHQSRKIPRRNRYGFLDGYRSETVLRERLRSSVCDSRFETVEGKNLKKLEGDGKETNATTTPESKTKPTSDSASESNAKVAEKISGHFSSLPSKELVPAKTIIQMNSVKTGLPLFMVHPIEGSVAMLNSLAQLINLPVYGIQCTPEAPSESIEQLAAWYWKVSLLYLYLFHQTEKFTS